MGKQTYKSLVLGSLVLMSGSISAYLLFLRPTTEEVKQAETVVQDTTNSSSTIELSPRDNSSSIALSEEELDTQLLTPQVNEPDLQVLGDRNVAEAPAPEQTQLPGPEGFEVYEEFNSSESALFVDILAGEGDEVVSGSTVAVAYQGWLTNGELFDQSRLDAEGLIEPFVFTVGSGSVITGWEQAIIGMKTGGSRRFVIPSVVGYGSSGQGSIPPDSLLVFDVQLLAVQ